MDPQYSELEPDLISRDGQPQSDDFDRFAAIPPWPTWEVVLHRQPVTGVHFAAKGFWTSFDGQVYRLGQRSEIIGEDPSNLLEQYVPQVLLAVVLGRPKPGPRDWSLRQLARYVIPGIPAGVEAREEVADLRRRLPELLAALPPTKNK